MTIHEHQNVTPAVGQAATDNSSRMLQGIGTGGVRRIDPRSRSPQLFTVEQAADRLNTTVRFVRRLIAERRIPFTKLGRHVRIDAADLDAFIAAGRVNVRPGA
ncbi:MAG TPA: helix-turn-helix domain-containing protein [Trebonia sp.]|jgi:excisionase family DNA binding protein|nr:helix-turn-helix domain-containing protein [Spirillospora sp.]